VDAGDLSFSVTVYTVCAVLVIVLFMARRYLGLFGQAELGGAVGPKWASGAFMIFLWLLYVTLSTLKTYGIGFD